MHGVGVTVSAIFGQGKRKVSISLALQNLKIYAPCLAMTRSTKII